MKKVCKACAKIVLLLALAIVQTACIPFIILGYPVYMFNKPLCIRLSTFITYAVWSLTSMVFNLSATMDGENIMDDDDYLIISNHLGAIDFMLINEIAGPNGMIGHLKYVVKDSLKVFPVFYQTIVYAGFLVLRRNFESDRTSIVRYFDLFKKNKIPVWFMLYPEGSRFTEKLKLDSWEYSDMKKMNRLDNVLLPRYKGFKLICEQLRKSRIKNVADITFFYLDGETPALWEFFLRDLRGTFRYDIKITPIDEIDDYREFLYRSFERKDALITTWKNEQRDALRSRS